MFSREHLSRNDPFHLEYQLLLIQVRLIDILKQDAHHPACIERQHNFQIINAELYTRDSVPRKFRQIDGHRFHEHPFDLDPPPGIYKLLKLRPVLPHKSDISGQRFQTILCIQALLHQFLRRPPECPFEDIHDILKVIIECLPRNMALRDQPGHRDFVYVFLLQHFGKGIC